MTRDNLYNEDRRRWRALTWDYGIILDQAELSGTLHCLSATTRMLLQSLIPYIGWVTRYDGEDIDPDLIKSWEEIATNELSGDMIRQNPANLCQMQMSCDGVTWKTVMDFSACLGAITPTQATAYNDELTDNATTYDDDISNLTDKWDYDGTYPDAETDEAICWAIRQYVAMVCDQQVKQINESNAEPNFFQQLSSASALSGAIAGAMAALGVFVITASTGGAALALMTVILAMSGSYDDEDPTLFQDADVRDAIACDIYNGMKGAKPTFARWQAALASTLGTDVVNDYVDETMDSEDLFMQFLFMTSGMVVAAADYDIGDCELICPDPTYFRLGGDGNANMAALAFPMAPPYNTTGTYIAAPTDHYRSAVDSGSPTTYRLLNVEYTLPGAPLVIDTIHFEASVHMRRVSTAHIKVFVDEVEKFSEVPTMTDDPVFWDETIEGVGSGTDIRLEFLIPVTSTGLGGTDLMKLDVIV